MKLLILGGYGVFGGRLAQLLADVDGLEILIAGRSLAAAEAFCRGWDGAATLRPLQLDRADVAAALSSERPDLIVDATGPFQAYGTDPYATVRAAIAAGVNYMDFADGSDFVFGIDRFDGDARAAGVFVLSGVSSFPVLTAAVLTEMGRTMTVRKVSGGIAPSPYAGVGMNVMRAVLGYAGGPVRLKRHGADAMGVGLGESLRYTVAVPGQPPLDNLRFSLVDVPDLQLLPQLMPQITDIWIGAGPVPESLHRMLNLLARARHHLRLPALSPLAPLCHRVLNAMRFGAHRGGMFVEAEGLQDGRPVTRSWHLIAEGDDGPLIPSMAIEGLVRKWLGGARPDPGARPATGALTLEDYTGLFARRAIRTGWRDGAEGPLYQQILGPLYADLPPRMAALHRPGARSIWRGRAEITRGSSTLSGLIAKLFGFPKAGRDVPVEVTFTTDAQGRETWQRRFGARIMQSRQSLGCGRNQHLVIEQFGPFSFGLAITWDGTRLGIIPRRWSCLGLPLPRFLMPGGDSHECEIDGRFHFHVEITVPLIGPVVRYEGWLLPEAL
ncbi:MAG: DUF4166 domain-containing protein [Albidovulum sp.]